MQSTKWQDNTNDAVLHPTEVKKYILNIDSRFRDYAQSSSSTDFMLKLPRVYKNIINIRLSSIELPNTWYAFTEENGETSLKYNGSIVTISDGNYDPNELTSKLQNAIRSQASTLSANVSFDQNSGKVTINNSGDPLILEFGSAACCCTQETIQSSYTPHNNGLGYLLGFTNTLYTNNVSYTAEYIVDTLRDNYVLLQLPELESYLDSYSYGNTIINAFAKIIVDVEKNALIYDNGGNLITKEVHFPQPRNLASFRVKLVDAYGIPIRLMANFSFTLELEEVVSSKTYESYRTNLLS